jgi:DNA mismatch endonuclease Vsr
MADVFDPGKRSEVMAKIRSKNTKSEVLVFNYLRKNKIYFRKHYDKVLGKPDNALLRKKKAVFIDGDFWHGRTLESLIKRRGAKMITGLKKSNKGTCLHRAAGRYSQYGIAI